MGSIDESTDPNPTAAIQELIAGRGNWGVDWFSRCRVGGLATSSRDARYTNDWVYETIKEIARDGGSFHE